MSNVTYRTTKRKKGRPRKYVVSGRYGRLNVTRELGMNKHSQAVYECDCDCGTKGIHVVGMNLYTGNARSCGCLQREAVTETGHNNRVHGGAGTPEYDAWTSMRKRCLNPERSEYRNYGERGIKICEEWLNSFEAFLDDMGPRPTKTHTLERIDNEKGYEPDNCCWETRKQQCRNKRTNVIVRYRGKDWVLCELAEHLGIGRSTLSYRIRQGWPIEQAVKPVET